MGESSGGGGRAEGPTSVQIFSSIIKSLETEGRHPLRVEFQWLAEGLYSLRVWIRGEPEPEEVFYFNPSEVEEIETSSAFTRTAGRQSKRT